MPKIELVEPGEAYSPTGGGTPKASAGRAKPGDTLVFPHVDSCIALVGKLNRGGVVGAHVGLCTVGERSDFDPEGNLTTAIETMQVLAGDAEITEIIAVVQEGSAEWDAYIESFATTAACEVKMLSASSDSRGIDLTVDHRGNMIASPCGTTRRSYFTEELLVTPRNSHDP